MPRYIDADLIDMEDMDFHEGQRRQAACEAAQDIIEAQPTADVAPIVHAYWKEINNIYDYNNNDFECSACGGGSHHRSAYCSKCGAKMDKR